MRVFPEVLGKNEVETIHEKSMYILSKTGVKIGCEEALQVFKKAGIRTDGNCIFPGRKLVEEKIREAPSHFTLYARNAKNNLRVGGGSFITAPGYGAPFVIDWDGGRRPAYYNDFENFAKLAGACANISMTGGVLVEPLDVPEDIRHAKMLYACIKNSDKCFMGSAEGRKKASDSIKMAEIIFGPEHILREKPVMISLINTITPLVIDRKMLGALIRYAEEGQPCIIAACSMAGSTSPASLAGTLAVQNAEILAGILLAQLVNPRTPVVYGSTSTITDMNYGLLAIGAPETALLTTATAQLASYYGLPSRSGGALTDSKYPDVQSAWESMMMLITAAYSNIDFVLHAAGILERYMSMSYAKFIMDDEICAMILRIKRGIDTSKESIPLELVDHVGPGGHFLDTENTFNTFRDEYWFPSVIDRKTYDQWMKEGKKSVVEAARCKYENIISEFEPPQVEKETDRRLQDFIMNCHRN